MFLGLATKMDFFNSNSSPYVGLKAGTSIENIIEGEVELGFRFKKFILFYNRTLLMKDNETPDKDQILINNLGLGLIF